MSSSTPTNNISMHSCWQQNKFAWELIEMVFSYHTSHLLDHAEKIVSEKGTLIGVRVHLDPQDPLTMSLNACKTTRERVLSTLFKAASSREDIPEVEFQMVSLFDAPPKRCLTFLDKDTDVVIALSPDSSDSGLEDLAFGTVGMTWWDVVVIVGDTKKGGGERKRD